MVAPHDKYVVIDRETMKFLGAAEGLTAASLLADLAPIATTNVVMPLDRKSQFASFGILELLLLIKNTTGQPTVPGAIHDFQKAVHDAYTLALALPLDTRSVKQLETEFANLPVIEVPKKMPKLPPVIARMSQEQIDNYVPGQNDHKKEPKAPRAPGVPGAAPSKGATGKVWTVADRVRAELGGGVITKDMRAKIIAACEAEGINAGTAATQFGKWKATQS